MNASDAFKLYDKAEEEARERLGKRLVAEIQRLLKIADDAPFSETAKCYVCTGNGITGLSCNSFLVEDKWDKTEKPWVYSDDYDLGDKIQDENSYCIVIVCPDKARAALKEIEVILEEVRGRDIFMSVLPYKIFSDHCE